MNNQQGIRMLPTVTLAGTEFYVDIRLQELREKENPYNSIPFEDIAVDESGSLAILYDPITKRAFDGTMEELRQREGILLIELPPLREIDLVGFARFYGLPEDTYIKHSSQLSPALNQKKDNSKHQNGMGL